MFEESVDAYRRRRAPARAATPWRRPRCCHGRPLPTCAWGRSRATLRVVARARGLLGDARRPRGAAAPGCGWTTSPRVVRVEQERPREAQALGRAGHGRRASGPATTRRWCAHSCSSTTPTSSSACPGSGRDTGRRSDLRRARARARGSRRSASTSGRSPTTRGGGPRRPSGTGPAARWRSRPAARSSPPRPTSTSPSCSSTRAHLDEAEDDLVDAIRVLRASGDVQVPRRGPDAAGQGAPQPWRAGGRRATGPRRWSRCSRRSEPEQRPGGRAGAGGGRAARSGRPRRPSAIIDAAEREAGAEAAFSMPRTCLQRGRALLALDRVEEADEMIASGLARRPRARSCPTRRRSCSG